LKKKKKLPRKPCAKNFSGAVAGEEEDFCKGSLSRTIFYFVFVLLYFIFAFIFLSKIQKKLVPLIDCIPLLLPFKFIMLFPKYVLEDLTIGSGSIIGKGNIQEFFNYISMHKDVEDRSLAELAPSYEVVAAHLGHMLEARFVNLNPFMQQMFLKLHDIADSEKKDFILETLRREFRDVAIEARKVFERFNMLGSPVNVVGTTKEDIKVPIPCKLVGLHEALEKNFDWICPEKKTF
jgi:hypothetical protein